MMANSIEAIINNTVALLIVFQSKLLSESNAGEEIVSVHTTDALSGAQF
jgi:hypothetical protein